MIANRHPVDELADVRAEIKRLQEREGDLRRTILETDCGMEGDEFKAKVSASCQERLDTAGLRREFKPEQLRKFLKSTEVKTIKISKIDRTHLAEIYD